MKWILVVLVAAVLAGVAFLGFGYWMSGRVPKWYRPRMSQELLDAAARKATRKISDVLNFIEPVNKPVPAHVVVAATTVATEPEARSITFTQDEINAFMLRWGEPYTDQYEKYVTGPQFTLKDGQIIFSGTVTSLGKFASLFVEPSIDDKGKLLLDVTAIQTGMLPVPESMVDKHITPLVENLDRWLPQWQKEAGIDNRGANQPAVKAAMTELLLHALKHEPAAPYLFIRRVEDKYSVPVRVTEIVVANGELKLSFRRLSVTEREEALHQITQPWPQRAAVK